MKGYLHNKQPNGKPHALTLNPTFSIIQIAASAKWDKNKRVFRKSCHFLEDF